MKMMHFLESWGIFKSMLNMYVKLNWDAKGMKRLDG